MNTVIYLHGFNSAFDPSSTKVMQLSALRSVSRMLGVDIEYHESDFLIKLEQFVSKCAPKYEQVALVGTSLGGFMARYLAQRHALPVIAINPSLRPWAIADFFQA